MKTDVIKVPRFEEPRYGQTLSIKVMMDTDEAEIKLDKLIAKLEKANSLADELAKKHLDSSLIINVKEFASATNYSTNDDKAQE